MMNHTDGWMWRDGRRDVDLDGNRRAGGGSTGRPDYQAVQEMTVDHHNAPQHNLHTNQAGNAGDCISSEHSRLPWWRLVRFFATTVLASFVLNGIWEMAQMPAYVETAGYSWTRTLGFCTRAAVGDVGIILGIYAMGALAIWAGAYAATGTFTPRWLFWGWLMQRWWNMRR